VARVRIMKRRRLWRVALEFIVVVLFLAGCNILETAVTPTNVVTPTPTVTPTSTPDPCTGWWCTVTGVVYAETAGTGNELAGATVTLYQTSYCSPTSGQHQTTTGSEGRYEMGEIFFHDTDRIRIQVESEGYETVQWDSVDFYCFYCGCFGSPIEIVLPAAGR
jgi:hypothetical protein